MIQRGWRPLTPSSLQYLCSIYPAHALSTNKQRCLVNVNCAGYISKKLRLACYVYYRANLRSAAWIPAFNWASRATQCNSCKNTRGVSVLYKIIKYIGIQTVLRQHPAAHNIESDLASDSVWMRMLVTLPCLTKSLNYDIQCKVTRSALFRLLTDSFLCSH